ncbi:PatA/PatG family cyanobactin maturation protease [Amycolatopsis samaneae]|uniref:PatA/PatG family cyanobactin maturation protease n=1 Tax=Amycolatopsis samaneae TaxID=664691 RepID=A0ABW5GXC2_9PSEU
MPGIPGLAGLWRRTLGEEGVCVAVVDGQADLDHPAFDGAAVSHLGGVWPDDGPAGDTAAHGTHVASVIFGQHGGPVLGIAPRCRGLVVPAFSRRRGRTSQLELARGIELAVDAGALVINVSGGQLSASGEAEDALARAVRFCVERGVLVVAAAGNDGCFCTHVPAALPGVLAVGALDEHGVPLAASNWGAAYRRHGIMAPGQEVLGARPGSGTVRATGTSLAAPIVAGVAGLLLSLQRQAGTRPDPLAVGAALLHGADSCDVTSSVACERFLTGTLNIEGAVRIVTSAINETPRDSLPATSATAASQQSCGCGCDGRKGAAVRGGSPEVVMSAEKNAAPVAHPVYAVGVLGYDFGSEARRDSFKQLMEPAEAGGVTVPANPYDPRRMVEHLTAQPSEARPLLWTVSLELTPIYAIEPVGPYAAEVYALLVRLLAGQVAAPESEEFLERVAVPGRMSGRTVRLFSGQSVPVIEVEQRRGLCGWEVNRLTESAVRAAGSALGDTEDEATRKALRQFLTRVYYDLRNLGATSRDRALNFAATNAFQAAHTFATALAHGLALESIGVEKSPFGRQDSDCWDVKLRFFDPENTRRAKRAFRFTIDVSDTLPVTVGEVRDWAEP